MTPSSCKAALACAALIAGASLLAACDSNDDGKRSSPGEARSVSPKASAPKKNAPRAQRFAARDVDLRLQEVARGLEAPLYVTSAGDQTGDLYVVEQGGMVRILRGGTIVTEPFLDLTDLVTQGGYEQGFLGLAFHPDYVRNGRFFVNYTDNEGDTMIAEYRRSSDDDDHADPTTARTLLRIDQPYPNHNGGQLAFGPDGYLYIGVGDGGGAADPLNAGQRLDTLLGKILRIDVDGERQPYAIPPDNPFVGESETRAEIWAFGLRNPWRFSFDRDTGDLWIGDVGQSELEEINHVDESQPGLDFGWDDMEGSQCFEPATGCKTAGRVLPVTEYFHDHGCAVTGGYVYRGRRFGDMNGGYFFGDYCSGNLWVIPATTESRRGPIKLLDTGLSISSFGEDDAGELYVTDLISGRVFQLEDAD